MSIYLRKVEEKDLPLLMAWRNSPIVYEGFYLRRSPVTWVEHRQWWDTRDDNWRGFIICVTEEGETRPVGFTYVKNINSLSPEVGLYIGEVTLWGKGVGKEAMSQLCEIIRTDYGKEFAICTILEQNRRSLGMQKGAGFVVVGEARQGEFLLRKSLNGKQ